MEQRRIATVTQINNYIKALLDQVPILQNIWIKGEISNCKLHSSGHIYLTLKDQGAVIRAVMFKYSAASLTFRPQNGTKVLARGRIGVYERDGQYQLYIEEMEEEGTGDLYAKFEALKRKLGEEGLFDESRKRPIPKFPKTIGLITSPTGAAVRDMIHVLRRRYPVARVVLYPVLVQGDGAAPSIVKAIEYFNTSHPVDVLIAGRGGGSIEDLWAFNEEMTARAVAASAIPIISAVGHETDFTICDFVADLRAPTPSAAAELAVPDMDELRRSLAGVQARMAALLRAKLDGRARQLELLSERSGMLHFTRRLNDGAQAVDRAFDALVQSLRQLLRQKGENVAKTAATLDALSPLAAFARGYSVACKDGVPIRSTKDVSGGDRLTLTVSDGAIACTVDGER